VLIFVILPLIAVFVEASVLMYKYVALSNAAREGARAGSIYLYVGDPGSSPALPDSGRAAAVAATVQDTVGPLILPPPDCNGTGADTTCRIVYGPSSAPIPDSLRSTDAMTVSITHTHYFLFGMLGNQMAIRARSSMRIEPSTVITASGP
jgi:Flp pilus assembly protein TadG